MPTRVRITDVSPRDGLQNEAGVIATTDKARLVEFLCAAGLDEIEVTSFVSKKWVPQLGDASELCALLAAQRPSRREGFGAGSSDTARASRPLFSALVPNDKGLDALLEANRAATASRGGPIIAKASVFAAASETFSRKNTNAGIDEVLGRFPSVIERAHDAGLLVRGYISCVIACPFEGPIAPAAVARVARALIEMGVDELDLGDTIGAATTQTLRDALLAVRSAIDVAGDSGERWFADGLVTLHLHDTFGRAAECVREALALGVRSFDASVAGLGGCPYASTTRPDGSLQRAPGNISTELLVRTIKDAGLRAGLLDDIDEQQLARAGACAREIVARARAAT